MLLPSNSALFVGWDLHSIGEALWTARAYDALTAVVKSCKNFKVRTKSAAALSVPTERKCYGTPGQFSQIWNALIVALQKSEDAEDFVEFKYTAGLRAQLCHSLLHLLSLADEADLPAIRRAVAEQGEVIRSYLLQYMKSGIEDEAVAVGGSSNERDKILQRALEHMRDVEQLSDGPVKRGAAAYLEDLLRSHRRCIGLTEA